MTTELNRLFRNYVDICQLNLQKRNKSQKKGPLLLFENKAMKIQDLVYHMEGMEEFAQLVAETENVFLGSRRTWLGIGPVQNFFRRSGFYADTFEGKPIIIEDIFNNFCDAFTKQEVQTRYLFPMEGVGFAQADIDFGSFHIKRFNLDELEEIFEINTNKLFYPHAITNANKIKNLWFIDNTENTLLKHLIPISLECNSIDYMESEYSRYQKGIDFILKQIILYDWHADRWTKSPFNDTQRNEEDIALSFLEIPFHLRTDNNLTASPPFAPDISGLWIETRITDQTGEEDFPFYYTDFDSYETEIFKRNLQHYINLYERLDFIKNGWHFFEIALRNFYKGFWQCGREKILWYLTALEALLGERKEGITERLAKRISMILGNSEKEREEIKRKFKKLYEFRCDLVHGNLFQKKVSVSDRHIREANNMCRQVILWFLNYLNLIQAGLPPHYSTESVPTREDMLRLLDLDQNNRDHLRKLIDILPSGFPCVSGWVE